MFAAINSFLTRAVSGYFLNKSLRFRSSASAYVSRTPAVSGNINTWTWSGWVKRGTSGFQAIYNTSLSGNNNYNYGFIGFLAGDDLIFYQYNISAVYTYLASTQLFRDYAAWYHIAIAYDDAQATASNRVKIYVNGAQITSFSTATYPTASLGGYFNRAQPTYFAKDAELSPGAYFDGEMAEVNFVDGQALAPTAFGAFSTYNQWLPIRYAGTYGTNGFYLPFNSVSTSSYAGSFNGSSQYLTVANTPLLEPSAAQAWTLETWINPTTIAVEGQIYQYSPFAISTTNDFGIYALLNSGGIVSAGFYNGTTQYAINSTTIPINTWTHVALVSTGSVLTLYINGVSVGAISVSAAPNATSSFSAKIGYLYAAVPRYFPGQISNFRFVKGTAVYTANFVPPTTALTAITNTSLLTLQNATIVDNSGNSLAITNNGTVVTSVQSPFLNPKVLTADSSGNGNNWTPNNISLTAGSTYDSLTDVPTLTSTTVANYAVLNPLVPPELSTTFNDGNLRFVGAGAVVGSMGMSAKTYVEMTPVSATSVAIGVGPLVSGSRGGVGQGIQDSVLWFSTGQVFKDGGATAVATYATFTTNDVCAFTFDPSNRQVTFYKNNVSQGSQTVSGTQAISFYTLGNTGATAAVNFGQQPFAYTPPSGFLPLNTYNI